MKTKQKTVHRSDVTAVVEEYLKQGYKRERTADAVERLKIRTKFWRSDWWAYLTVTAEVLYK